MDVIQNNILSALNSQEYQHLHSHLEIIDLPAGRNIYNSGDGIHYIYFPLDAVIYQFISMENGATVEAGIIGSEGLLGVSVLMGIKIASKQAVSLISQQAVRIKAEILKREFDKGGLLQKLVLKIIHSLYVQIAQTAACNRIHSNKEKLCRWLLMTHDRSKSDILTVTQEFIAQMLGTCRPYLTIAVGLLQKEGIIGCRRGQIEIINRQALEEQACECYNIIRSVSDRPVEYVKGSAFS